MQPDLWCTEWLSDEIILRNVIKFDNNIKVRSHKCNLKKDRGKSQRSMSNINVGMEWLQHCNDDPTDIYFCIPQGPLVHDAHSKFQMVEYIMDTNDNVLFVGAPLFDDTSIFDQVYMQHTHLSPKEHNALLNTLLKSSDRLKFFCIVVCPGNSSTEQIAVVLLLRDSELPSGNNMTRLASRISKKTYPSVSDGAVKISEGFPCQWIYSWSFIK